jgi:guanyl-specific ribonuclease Sa
MIIRLLPLIVASQLSMTVADAVPKFDGDNACRGVDAAAVAPGRTVESCKNDENVAHDTLNQSWTQFLPDDRQRCVSLTTTGGPPSYVELLTCMEMARDARKLPKDALAPSMAPASR